MWGCLIVFDEIVQEVCDRLNLTSDEAKSRVGREVNARYRRVTAGIGGIPARRTQVSKPATIGSRFLTFTGIEKITAVIDKSSGKDKPLDEISHDEMIKETIKTEPPNKWSLYSTGSSTVTIWMNTTPATAFTLYADGFVNASTLSGQDTPAFAESFHDILVYGAMADEYKKMEKEVFYRDTEAAFEQRVSDLRMFLAVSGYIDIYQGKDRIRKQWWEV